MLLIRATTSTYGSVETGKEGNKKEEYEQLAVLTNSSLVLPRWLLATLKVFVVAEHSYECQVPIKPYSCCFSRVSQASVCIAHMACPCPCHLYRLQYLPRVACTCCMHMCLICAWTNVVSYASEIYADLEASIGGISGFAGLFVTHPL